MIKRALLSLSLLFATAVGAAALISQPAYAATACDRDGMILTIKPWYYGLTNSDCSIVSPDDLGGGDAGSGLQVFITRVILTVVEGLLHIAGYVTVIFIIYGGFIYLTSSGAPDKASKGLKTVINAAIGLFVAMASIALVNFIAAGLGLPT